MNRNRVVPPIEASGRTPLEACPSPLELNLPLTRHHCLLEASAGTGKSFSLILIYLRLLLGVCTERPPLSFNQILILTFTVEATQSLRRRIREVLAGLLSRLKGGAEGSALASIWQELLERSPLSPQEKQERLQKVYADLSTAPILTIHGFCARVLKHWAFRTGQMSPHFHLGPWGGTTDSLWQSASAFWIRWVESSDPWERGALLEAFPSVEALVKALQPLMEQSQLEIEGAFASEAAFLQAYRSHRRGLKKLQSHFESHPSSYWEAEFKAGLKSERGASIQAVAWVKKLQEAFSDFHEQQSVHELYERLLRFSQWQLREDVPPPFEGWVRSVQWHVSHWVHARPALLKLAWHFAQEEGSQTSWRDGPLSFRDLLTQLEKAMQDSAHAPLIQDILNTYPVALIDEFQDTDIKQYRILQSIYTHPLGGCKGQVFLIGDPKQSIYGFRGADLATYHFASQEVRSRAYLTVNWRSNAALLEALNHLWSSALHPFIYPEIHFRSSQYPQGKPLQWLALKGERIAALQLHVEAQGVLGMSQYRSRMAERCAADVVRWRLAILKGEAEVVSEQGERRPLRPQDMVVLVKHATEAQDVIRSLNRWGIEAVYTSQETDLFKTEGGAWLLDLVQAIAGYDSTFALHQLFSHPQLDCFEENFNPGQGFAQWLESHRSALERACAIWSQKGLCASVQWVLPRIAPLQSALAKPDFLSRRDDFFQALQALVHWEAGMASAPPKVLFQELKTLLEGAGGSFKVKKSAHPPFCIAVSTVFKAKGMEYPWVWIPFAAAPHRRKGEVQFGSIHRTGAYIPLKLLTPNQEERESQSEAMRLLYVAMTRATQYLALGVAPVRQFGSGVDPKKGGLPFNPFQHLLLQGKSSSFCSLDEWRAACQRLKQGLCQISLGAPLADWPEALSWPKVQALKAEWKALSSPAPKEVLQAPLPENPNPAPSLRFLPWHIKSYSSLCRSQPHCIAQALPAWLRSQAETSPWEAFKCEAHQEEEALPEAASHEPTPLAPGASLPSPKALDASTPLFDAIAQFPRGPQVGDWVHRLLEQWDFRSPLLPLLRHLPPGASGFRLEPEWEPWLVRWLQRVVAQPLWKGGPCLQGLEPSHYCAEMNFSLQVPSLIQPRKWIGLIRSLGWVTVTSGHSAVEEASEPFLGAIKGFIDGVFEWEGKYYLLDYKTNALGSAPQDYAPEALEAAMASHAYDVQLAFYQWALHEHLKMTLPGYQPQRHLGGGLYLFLRGMASERPSRTPLGVWKSKVTLKQIRKLEKPWEWNLS